MNMNWKMNFYYKLISYLINLVNNYVTNNRLVVIDIKNAYKHLINNLLFYWKF